MLSAGADSIFVGGRLLTTPLPGLDEDARLLADLGMRAAEVSPSHTDGRRSRNQGAVPYRPPDGLLRRPLFSKRRLRLRTVDAERVFATFRPRRELVSAHDLAPRRIEQRLSPALISGAGRILEPRERSLAMQIVLRKNAHTAPTRLDCCVFACCNSHCR